MTDKQCERCGKVNPAEIHTCTPKQEPVAWMYNGNLHEFDPSDWAEGEVIPLYTATPQREEGCAECGKQASDGWALYCVKCSEPVQEPVGWIYEDDEGRIIFSQMPHPDPLWEPVYRVKK